MTSFANLDGVRCLSVVLNVPTKGPWWADISVDSADELSGKVTLSIGDTKFEGTIVQGGELAELQNVRIVAGAGGWGTLVSAQHYHNDSGVRVKNVLEDAARLAGETLANVPSIPNLGSDYVRDAGPASRILEDVAGFWFVDYDGKTYLEERAASKVDTEELDLLSYDPRRKLLKVATLDLGSIRVGATLNSDTIGEPIVVSHFTLIVDKEGVKVELFGQSEGDLSTLLRGIAKRATLGPLFGCYSFRVYQMNGEKVELQPIRKDLGLPDLIPVPMRPGVAGAFAKLKPGENVLVSFEDGDRRYPVVIGFTESSSEDLSFSADMLRLGSSGASEAAVLGDALHQWVQALTFPTAFGPTGPAINLADFAQTLSQKVKVE